MLEREIADNGLVLFMWIGLSVSCDWVRDVLGVTSVAQVDIDKVQSLRCLLLNILSSLLSCLCSSLENPGFFLILKS